ncbi:MAG: hypothetical protein ABW321_34685 [Polyangiales bacterium]
MNDFQQLRNRLLELHKALLTEERQRFEQIHGRVTPQAFWQALTADPSLAWLAPLNTAIVRLDELPKDAPEAERDAQLATLRELLTLREPGPTPAAPSPQPFSERYAALFQASPEVAFAHAALWNLLDR